MQDLDILYVVGWSMDLLLIFQLKVNVGTIGYQSMMGLWKVAKRVRVMGVSGLWAKKIPKGMI